MLKFLTPLFAVALMAPSLLGATELEEACYKKASPEKTSWDYVDRNLSEILRVCEAGISKFPENADLWALLSRAYMVRSYNRSETENDTPVFDDALALANKSASAGSAAGQYAVGKLVGIIGGDTMAQWRADSMAWYVKSAEQGYSPAQLQIARNFRFAFTVDENIEESIRWYKLAANQGNLNAQINLGEMHINGRHLDRDYLIATKWYTMAASQGSSVAMYNLADFYKYGRSVPRDMAKYGELYQLAEEVRLTSDDDLAQQLPDYLNRLSQIIGVGALTAFATEATNPIIATEKCMDNETILFAQKRYCSEIVADTNSLFDPKVVEVAAEKTRVINFLEDNNYDPYSLEFDFISCMSYGMHLQGEKLSNADKAGADCESVLSRVGYGVSKAQENFASKQLAVINADKRVRTASISQSVATGSFPSVTELEKLSDIELIASLYNLVARDPGTSDYAYKILRAREQKIPRDNPVVQKSNRLKVLFDAFKGAKDSWDVLGNAVSSTVEISKLENRMALLRSASYGLSGNICQTKYSVYYCFTTQESSTAYLGRGLLLTTNRRSNSCGSPCQNASGLCDMNTGTTYASSEAAELDNCRSATRGEVVQLLGLKN